MYINMYFAFLFVFKFSNLQKKGHEYLKKLLKLTSVDDMAIFGPN